MNEKKYKKSIFELMKNICDGKNLLGLQISQQNISIF